MSDAENQGEPTMEEILASIRKIISEDSPETDEEAEAEAVAGEPEPEPEPEPAPEEPEPEPEPEPELAAAEPEPEQDDEAEDVLDLTQVVKDDGSVVDLHAEAPEPEPEPRPEPEPAEAVVMAEEAVEVTDVAPAAAPELVEQSLLSDETRSAATASLLGLASAALSDRDEQATTGGDKTLEQLVQEALRPYLKAWLDENLPGLVERIVREEIQKLIKRAEYR